MLLHATVLNSVHEWKVFWCGLSKQRRMRGSPLWHWRPASFMFYIWHDYKNTHKGSEMRRCSHTCNKERGHCHCLDSPKAWVDCVTPSKYSRIPLQGGLDIRSSPLLSVLPGKWQWVKLWWGGSGGEEAIDWRAFVEMEEYLHLPLRPHRQTEYNTHRNIIYPTHTHIHTHTAEGAAQMGSSVTNDYLPATLTRRDWSHTNASVALSDGWGQKLEWSTTRCLWEVIIRCESCLVRS